MLRRMDAAADPSAWGLWVLMRANVACLTCEDAVERPMIGGATLMAADVRQRIARSSNRCTMCATMGGVGFV